MGCRAAGLLLSRRVAPSLLHMLVRQRHNKRKKAVPTSANMKMFKDQTQTSPEAARYRLNAPRVFTLEREQQRSSFIHDGQSDAVTVFARGRRESEPLSV